MKKITLFTLAICCFVKTYSQNQTVDMKVLEQATFIFEGTITNENYQKIGTSFISTIKISKIFRGDDKIKIGSIELITEENKLDNYDIIWTSEGGQIARKGIFFCMLSAKDLQFSNNDDNSIKIVSIGNIWYSPFNSSATGLGKTFKNANELYDFLGQQSNITIPKEQEK